MFFTKLRYFAKKKVKGYELNIKVPRFREEEGFYTTAARSSIMRKIKAKNTKTEVRLRLALWHLGYRYHKNVKKLPGCPDVVFTRSKLAIFIDGEFWHGFNWEEKRASIKSNREFWIPKIERNMQRDRQNAQALENLGYRVIRFWEKEVKEDLDGCIHIIQKNIQKDY